MSLPKLYIPGPVDISPETYAAMAEPIIGHRGGDFEALYASIAFSDKWYSVAKSCGKDAEKIQVEWGEAICPDAVRAKLEEGGFDTVTLVHNETSTGVLNPLAEIAKVVKSFDDVLLVVDTVSSFSAVPTPIKQMKRITHRLLRALHFSTHYVRR